MAENAAVELLLVEDNPSDARLALYALRLHGLGSNVHVVRDGAAALDFLFGTGPYEGRSLREHLKVVVLDLDLPLVDGIEVLRQARAHPETQGIPFVMLTSSGEEDDVVESYRVGANSYIVKPADFDEFSEAIRHLGRYWLQLNRPARA